MLTVLLCVAVGIGWTGLLVAAAALFVWIAEKWWVVLDPQNPLIWLRFLPGIWRWAHEDETAPPMDARPHPAFTRVTPPD